MPDNYTPLFSEILGKLSKLKTKNQKIAHLRKYNSDALRQVIKSSFDPKVKWALPYGDVPYIQNEAPMGTEHNNLSYESRRSEEHTSELQSQAYLVCRLLLEKKNRNSTDTTTKNI